MADLPSGSTGSTHPYAEFVHRVEKPARYLGGEYGSAKREWNESTTRICLAFPDVYDIGMSHLGFKILYKILNDDPRTLAERCFVPWIDMEKELRTRGLPLVSLESAKPLREFDVVGFSLQFELTYTNILTMLELGGIPLRSADRAESDPLIIAGGPVATHPEPLTMFVDAIVIGDGEERTTELSVLWTELKKKGVPRKERLAAVGKLRGVYVPSLYDVAVDAETGLQIVDRALEPGLPLPVKRNLLDDLNKFPFPDSGPVGGPEAIFDRMSIEIARGCTEGCRFCQAGMIYRPVRERDPEQIVDTLVAAVKKSGYDEVSLTSLSTADYSCIAPLIKKVTDRLAPEKVSLGVSSLRAYGLEETVLDDIRRVRASGVTFAPEAGSQRMRDVVNKNVTEEQLMTTAERIFSRGWDGMKLYFMIGLPTEEESDVREIVKVGKRAREVGWRVRRETNQGGPPKVTVSVSTHVPKPHTPFQWCAMDREQQVLEKQSWLKDEGRAAKGVDIRMHDSRTSWLEGVFARGDRKLGLVLERAYKAGCRFDSWEDQLKIDVWSDCFREEGIEPGAYLGTIPVSARLPWDHIDVGLEEGFLLREYRKALKSRLSPPCGKVAGAFIHHTNLEDALADDKKLVCYDCGVACDLSAMRKERLVYLERLGAQTKRVAEPKRLPVVKAEKPGPARHGDEEVVTAPVTSANADGTQPEVKKERKGPKPPPRIIQGEPRRYRFLYGKVGPMAFLSHLDLIRALPRSFRRLEVPIYYSSGFHPKPEMMFSPALSLGVASLSEILDVKLTVDIDPNELAASLARVSSEGLAWKAGIRLEKDDTSIAHAIDATRYAVAIPRRALEAIGGEARLHEEIARLMGSPEHKVIRRFEKGLAKAVDVKKFLRSLTVNDTRAVTFLEEARLLGDFVPLLADVDVTLEGGVKISEIMEALFGKTPEGLDAVPYHAVRAELGLRNGDAISSPLELDLLRERAAVAKAAKEAAKAAAAEAAAAG
ncbi:Fe-S oxidoreductase [Labilithrix luteola]|uniref:Fe-S oxidoreductase n=1 Tax=Labilithrix luteola TaxID=1391654 RepID=A0A0K1PVY6_9BACT|nr:TIGR03960 family B12-binding radical SAM protein [Labilithrix luteola]AKU97284.1 Fe-S oxidoreductase [Labilithrix luteola]